MNLKFTRKNNKLITDAQNKHHIANWEMADVLDISEMTFIRKMRHELPMEEQKEIVSLIEKHVNERGYERNE